MLFVLVYFGILLYRDSNPKVERYRDVENFLAKFRNLIPQAEYEKYNPSDDCEYFPQQVRPQTKYAILVCRHYQ